MSIQTQAAYLTRKIPWWHRLVPFRGHSPAPDPDVAFPPGFFASLDRLRILGLRAAGGGLKEGHRLGAYKGGQLEFHDYRAYAPGDDLRYLDWNLYARLDRPFVKEFAREEAGVIYLLLDATPSMALGRPAKWTFTRREAALFAHVGWSARDEVRAFVFREAGAEVSTYPPRGRRGAVPEFLDWLRRLPVAAPVGEAAGAREGEDSAGGAGALSGQGALRAAVRSFLRAAPARGRVFVLSDFWQEEAEISAAVQSLTACGHELAALHVLAAEETSAPEPGALRVLALEEAGEVELDMTASAAARYVLELEAHQAMVEQLFRRRGGAYLFAHSNTPLERVLIQALRRRRWME